MSEGTRDEKGRFIKGVRASKKTEFKKGQHWRKEKPYWNKEWLYNEYVIKQKSSYEIASEFDCKENNILHFLNKHNIPTRTVSEARAIKHWGASGKDNPMYGKTGDKNPNWKGGVSPERQEFYSSRAWKKAVRAVWKRDKGVCRRCGARPQDRGEFHIHHIVSFKVVELRTDVDNLILLCPDCHWWVHSKQNTEGQFLGKEVLGC